MGSVRWDDQGTSSLVQARHVSATLPILLCAPHGGNPVDGDQAESLLERSLFAGGAGVGGESGRGGGAVSLVADVGTSQLLEEIDRRLTRKFCAGEDGFVKAVEAAGAVVARFHRKYVDANRPLAGETIAVHPSCARAREVHESYHRAIETALRALGTSCRCRKPKTTNRTSHHHEDDPEEDEKEKRLLLLDLHGQGKFVDKVLIGTNNGTTADLEALNTPGKGFLWHLRRHLDAADAITDGSGATSVGNDRAFGREGDNSVGGKGVPNETGGAGVIGGDEAAAAVVARGNGPTCDRSIVVLPPYGDDEVPKYTGGYTVRRYGLPARRVEEAPGVTSGAPRRHREGEDGIAVAVDAIQLEFGSQLRRTPEARAIVAEAVAAAIFCHLGQRVSK